MKSKKKQIRLRRVSRDYTPREWCVYCISKGSVLPSYVVDHYVPDVYVGITEGKAGKRWNDHKALRKRGGHRTMKMIDDNSLTFEEGFWLLFEGTERECRLLEYHLRPRRNMGLNGQVGGGTNEFRVHDNKISAMVEEFLNDTD
jgi:hypothetical protein